MLFAQARLRGQSIGGDTKLKIVRQSISEQVFSLIGSGHISARGVETDGRGLDAQPSFGERVCPVGEVGRVGQDCGYRLHPAQELVLNGRGGVSFSQQPTVFKDQIHQPGEEKGIAILVDAKAVMIDSRRIRMDVGIVVLLLIVAPKAIARIELITPVRPSLEPVVSRPAAALESMPSEVARGATSTRLALRLRAIELRLWYPNAPPDPAGGVVERPGSVAIGSGLVSASTAVGPRRILSPGSSAVAGNPGSGSGGNGTRDGIPMEKT